MAKHWFYGGRSVKDGQQCRLKTHTFQDFVKSYINVPIPMRTTREEFHNYDEDTQKKFKDVPYVCACSFKKGLNKRNDKNASKLLMVALDIDAPSKKEKKQGFKAYADDFVESPEALRDALYPFNFAAYETASSTPKHRNLRILVEVKPCDLKHHKALVTTVARLLGMDLEKWKGNRESNVISQPMYRPVAFQEEEDRNPVLCSRTNGEPLTKQDIPKGIHNDFKKTSMAFDFDESEEIKSSLMFMPVPELTIREAESALDHVDPDCGYLMWTKIASALRHQFRGEEADEAFDVFDQWSSTGSKYQGASDTSLKWRSFKPDAEGKNPTTIRTLFQYAIEGGWNSSEVASKVQATVEEWIVSCTDSSLLMTEGIERIAAIPFQNDVVEEALISHLQEASKEINGVRVERGVYRKAVKAARRKSVREKAATEDNSPAWLRPWVYVSTTNTFYNMTTGVILGPDAFNNNYAKELINQDDIDEMMGRPSIMPKDFALNIQQIKRVDGFVYDPRNNAEPFLEYKGVSCLNTYRQSSVPKETPLYSDKAFKILKKFLKMLLGDPEAVAHMIDFLAHTVQHPGHKIRWAFLIQSAHGAGKTLLSDVMGEVMGIDNVKYVHTKSLTSDFNDWAVDNCFTVFEELWVKASLRFELGNAVKDVISNDRISVRKKFEGMSVGLNVTNSIAFTNYHDAIHMDASDRRWLAVESPLQTKEQCVRAAKQGLFKGMVKLKKKGGGSLRYALLNYKISKKFPVNGPAPMTAYRQELVEESKPRLLIDIEDVIEDPDVPEVGHDIIHSQALHTALVTPSNSEKPTHYLRQLGYKPYGGGKKVSIQNQKTTLWFNPAEFNEKKKDAAEVLRKRLKVLELD